MERSMVNFVTFLFRRLKNVWRVRRLRVYGNADVNRVNHVNAVGTNRLPCAVRDLASGL